MSGKNIKELVERLRRIKASFGPGCAENKAEMIRALSRLEFRAAKHVVSYHESLCYLRAYPDSRSLLRFVESELAAFIDRIVLIGKSRAGSESVKLDETGLVGTSLTHAYGYEMTKWLLTNYRQSVELDWETYENQDSDPILSLLPMFLSWLENDAIDDPYLATREIVEAAIGAGRKSTLEWFFSRYDKLPIPQDFKRLQFESFDLPIEIAVGVNNFARTLIKRPPKKCHFQHKPLDRSYPNIVRQCRKPDLEIILLGRDEGAEIIDLQKRALVMRHRELYPTDFANPDEVYQIAIGRGIDLFVIGTEPTMRLPLESNYSALMLRNGIPIGYGIGAMIFERIEIAINIFDTFREGDARFIFGKFAQVYHQLFGSTYLLIRKYQVGDDNPEGIDSGAYWFYYKLGFRSIDSDIRELAEQEVAKLRRTKSYRTPRPVLKHLARSDLCLNLTDPADFSEHDFPVGDIALLQTKLIAERYDGDRKKALRDCIRIARRALDVRSLNDWTTSEKLWFKRLSLLVALLPDADHWSRRNKNLLLRLIRAKGSMRERKYIRLMRQSFRLKAALLSLLEPDQ